MNSTIRNIQLVAVLIVLFATVIAFFLEIHEMYENRDINLAACIELIHNATLLHDDVIDESNLRRGNKTANSIWGNQSSILTGDYLLSRCFEIMVDDGDLEILKLLSSTSSKIAQGEVLQHFRNSPN